jgi:hypothetical protein
LDRISALGSTATATDAAVAEVLDGGWAESCTPKVQATRTE